MTVDVNDAQLTQSFVVRSYPALPLERVLELRSAGRECSAFEPCCSDRCLKH